MPLQNRVDPSGKIHAISARGLFTGNRGVIHDPDSRTLLKRRWTTKAWIICDCGYRNRKREVFGRNARTGGAGWTNLFFLDEITALAAGHRPCFECRRAKASEFIACFGQAFGVSRPRVADIDERLHPERVEVLGRKIVAADIAALPDGAVLRHGDRYLALRLKTLLAWSFEGYGASIDIAQLDAGELSVVTPATTISVLRAGYRPVWHPSAQAI